MNEETARRLRDVLAACRAIDQFVIDMDFDTYIGSLVTRSAVERQLEIIGEALNRAAIPDERLQTLIPELRQVVGVHNRLIHGYDSVDDEILWDVVRTKMLALQSRVAKLLVESGEPLGEVNCSNYRSRPIREMGPTMAVPPGSAG